MKTQLTNTGGRLTLAAMAKEELIYTRLSTALRNRLAIEANNRGEAEAVIVREALNEYFTKRDRGDVLRESSPGYAVNSGRPQAQQRRIVETLRKRRRPPKS